MRVKALRERDIATTQESKRNRERIALTPIFSRADGLSDSDSRRCGVLGRRFHDNNEHTRGQHEQ